MTKKHRPSMENPLADDFAPPVERQYYSVGFVCQMISQTPAFVERLMRACDVEYAWTTDGIGVINGADLQRMAAMLEQARDVVEKSECAPNN